MGSLNDEYPDAHHAFLDGCTLVCNLVPAYWQPLAGYDEKMGARDRERQRETERENDRERQRERDSERQRERGSEKHPLLCVCVCVRLSLSLSLSTSLSLSVSHCGCAPAPGLFRLMDGVMKETGLAYMANMYLTPRNSQGFVEHTDNKVSPPCAMTQCVFRAA